MGSPSLACISGDEAGGADQTRPTCKGRKQVVAGLPGDFFALRQTGQGSASLRGVRRDHSNQVRMSQGAPHWPSMLTERSRHPQCRSPENFLSKAACHLK
ncbi:hypothetical protein BOS5A_230170 [Bosea sp. EC-HK365B]|nr:hypothetical protein BOSE21B_90246 [Bosea sp. 21B]CAD5298653.1 hypothetical protein BOSE7B_60419 [Bosea sp. 7B]VVT60893.1 hypothetical protein BOS5A_230170 [Bosea sp. EC-HK365B]VXB37394.1 hypothetical protein BOSE127_110417 [Bosea sp. 127]